MGIPGQEERRFSFPEIKGRSYVDFNVYANEDLFETLEYP